MKQIDLVVREAKPFEFKDNQQHYVVEAPDAEGGLVAWTLDSLPEALNVAQAWLCGVQFQSESSKEPK